MRFSLASVSTCLVAGLFLTACGDTDADSVYGPLGHVDMTDCQPTVCPATGDPYLEWKSWNVSHPCEEPDQDLQCRLRSALDGEDWPDKVEAEIEQASANAGGFSEDQKQALRCLAFMESARDFNIGYSADRMPDSVMPNLQFRQEGGSRIVANEFLNTYGPYLGRIWNVGPGYEMTAEVEDNISAIIITARAESYRGFQFRYPTEMKIRLERFATADAPTCDSYYINTEVSANFMFGIESIPLEETERLTPEQALAGLLEQCTYCTWGSIDESKLWIGLNGLEYEFHVGCPSHCPDFPDWTCTARVDACSGQLLDVSEDCCVDCFDE